jgi:hypothetical protein
MEIEAVLGIMLLSTTVVAVAVLGVFLRGVRVHQTLFRLLCRGVQAVVDDTTKDLETLAVQAVGLQVVVQVVDTQTAL